MPFGLSLPPIVVILLLAFVWVIVLVLLVWYLLPWGEHPGDAEEPTERRRGGAAEPQRPSVVQGDTHIPRPPAVRVREALPDEPKRGVDRPDTQDAFDNYGRAGRRRCMANSTAATSSAAATNGPDSRSPITHTPNSTPNSRWKCPLTVSKAAASPPKRSG